MSHREEGGLLRETPWVRGRKEVGRTPFSSSREGTEACARGETIDRAWASKLLGSYVLTAGMSSTALMPVHFAASILHGTPIRFAAWADSLNSACADGAKIEWDMTLPWPERFS